jgi:hypothetical protein
MMIFDGFVSIEWPERRGPEGGEKGPLKPTGHFTDKSGVWLKYHGYRSQLGNAPGMSF